MTAEKIELPLGNGTVVIVKEEGWRQNCLVTFVGMRSSDLADALVTSVMKNMCPECGGFNGAHKQTWVKTGQDGAGSVEGVYIDCNTGKKK